jgi:hypothetical protein
LHVLLGRIYEIILRVAIMIADPDMLKARPVFFATLGGEIKEVICAVQNIDSPPIGGIGMKDLAPHPSRKRRLWELLRLRTPPWSSCGRPCRWTSAPGVKET